MLGAFVGAAVGAFLAGGVRRGRTIERHTVYRDVDYDKLARKTSDYRDSRDCLDKACDKCPLLPIIVSADWLATRITEKMP